MGSLQFLPPLPRPREVWSSFPVLCAALQGRRAKSAVTGSAPSRQTRHWWSGSEPRPPKQHTAIREMRAAPSASLAPAAVSGLASNCSKLASTHNISSQSAKRGKRRRGGGKETTDVSGRGPTTQPVASVGAACACPRACLDPACTRMHGRCGAVGSCASIQVHWPPGGRPKPRLLTRLALSVAMANSLPTRKIGPTSGAMPDPRSQCRHPKLSSTLLEPTTHRLQAACCPCAAPLGQQEKKNESNLTSDTLKVTFAF